MYHTVPSPSPQNKPPAMVYTGIFSTCTFTYNKWQIFYQLFLYVWFLLLISARFCLCDQQYHPGFLSTKKYVKYKVDNVCHNHMFYNGKHFMFQNKIISKQVRKEVVYLELGAVYWSHFQGLHKGQKIAVRAPLDSQT